MQFFYLLCSQFRQKASSWINKTLRLVKQQKWLSEFCVKIPRVASKNLGRSGDRKHTYFFFGLKGTYGVKLCLVMAIILDLKLTQKIWHFVENHTPAKFSFKWVNGFTEDDENVKFKLMDDNIKGMSFWPDKRKMS